jgi:hypothetical protein
VLLNRAGPALWLQATERPNSSKKSSITNVYLLYNYISIYITSPFPRERPPGPPDWNRTVLGTGAVRVSTRWVLRVVPDCPLPGGTFSTLL